MSRGERLALALLRRLEWKGIINPEDVKDIINQAVAQPKKVMHKMDIWVKEDADGN